MKIQSFKILIAFLFVFFQMNSNGQGFNHSFFLGYTTGIDSSVTSRRGQLNFDSLNVVAIPNAFTMPFDGAQANICDENGNLCMVSNGCWIADATGDTMQNGAALNPGSFANNWCDQSSGIQYVHSSIILPFPGDTSKLILFHQAGNSNLPNGVSSELFYTLIDKSQNGGLGTVMKKILLL